MRDMVAPYSSLAVANSFVKSFASNDGVEHMKLQKLVYCAYGWWLAAKGLHSVRLTHDGPEIWKFGPVFSDLYRVMRVFGRRPIESPQAENPFAEPILVPSEDEQATAIIDWTWRRYGHLSSFALSDMTHKQGTPWHRVATESNFLVSKNTRIPDEYVYEEFFMLMQKTEQSTLHGNSRSESREIAGTA